MRLCSRAQRRKRKEMNISHLISSIYLYIHLWPLSFSSILYRCCCIIFPLRSTSSIFFFLYVPETQKVQQKKTDRGETNHFSFSPLLLPSRSIFVSYLGVLNTRIVCFFPHISSERGRRRKKTLRDDECARIAKRGEKKERNQRKNDT